MRHRHLFPNELTMHLVESTSTILRSMRRKFCGSLELVKPLIEYFEIELCSTTIN